MTTSGISLAFEPQSAAPQSHTASASVVPCNNKVLIAILGLMIGTGGVANATAVNTALRPNSSANSQIRLTIFEPIETENGRQNAVLPQEQIVAIQRYLSVNMTDLSKALRVGRPTVYSWVRGTQPHGRNLERIHQLYRIARSWRAMSSTPVGEYLTIPLQTGRSLMADLCTRNLDEGGIDRAFTEIRAALSNRPRRESIMEVAARRGMNSTAEAKAKKWSSDDDFDL